MRDINIANSSIVFLQELDFDKGEYHYTELRRFRAFEANAIIAYCRPFAMSKKGTTINMGYAGIKFDENAQALHEKIMTLRSKIIAHSDEDFMHFNFKLHDMGYKDMDGNKIDLPFPNLVVDEGLYLDQSEIWDFHEHVRKLQYTLYKSVMKISKAYPELIEGYVKPDGMD